MHNVWFNPDTKHCSCHFRCVNRILFPNRVVINTGQDTFPHRAASLSSLRNLYFWVPADACNHHTHFFPLADKISWTSCFFTRRSCTPARLSFQSCWVLKTVSTVLLSKLTFLKWRQQEILKSENHLVLSFHSTNSFYVWRTEAMAWSEPHWKQKVTSAIYRIYYTSLGIEAQHIHSMVTANQWNDCPSPTLQKNWLKERDLTSLVQQPGLKIKRQQNVMLRTPCFIYNN